MNDEADDLEPPTVRPPPRESRAHESERLEAWIRGELAAGRGGPRRTIPVLADDGAGSWVVGGTPDGGKATLPAPALRPTGAVDPAVPGPSGAASAPPLPTSHDGTSIFASPFALGSPLPFATGAAAGSGTQESARLERWVRAELARRGASGASRRPTAAFDATAMTAAPLGATPMSPVAPAATTPPTTPAWADVAPSAPALVGEVAPYAPGSGHPAPASGFAGPRPPDPLTGRETAPVETAPAAAPAPPRSSSAFEPLSLEVYARIKVAGWRGAEALTQELAAHGVDELRWREHETWLREAMATGARRGDASLVLGVAAAVRRARLEARPAAASVESELGRYTRLRAAVELAGEEGEASILAQEGVPRHEWDDLRVAWSERLRGDPELARRVRKAVGKARRTLLDERRAAELAASA